MAFKVAFFCSSSATVRRSTVTISSAVISFDFLTGLLASGAEDELLATETEDEDELLATDTEDEDEDEDEDELLATSTTATSTTFGGSYI